MQRQDPIPAYKTDYFQLDIDYIEGSCKPDKSIYFGSRRNFKEKYQDLDKYGKDSLYYGRILYPERVARKLPTEQKAEWSFEKNAAFWAGGIDANRQFVLMSNIDYYPGVRNNGITCSIYEILWLVDNDYEISPCKENRNYLIFMPPKKPLIERTLIDYRKISNAEVLNKFEQIKEGVIKKRDQHFGQQQAKIPPQRLRPANNKPSFFAPLQQQPVAPAAQNNLKRPAPSPVLENDKKKIRR